MSFMTLLGWVCRGFEKEEILRIQDDLTEKKDVIKKGSRLEIAWLSAQYSLIQASKNPRERTAPEKEIVYLD